MDEMNVSVTATGIEDVLKQLDPKQSQYVLIRWFETATRYVKQELRSRTPSRIKDKVRSMNDGMIPPRWARIFVKSPLAHLLEGGTGTQGVAPFNHASEVFPAIDGQWGIMVATGLPRPQAFAVARTIAKRGGNPPQPFIQPTFAAVEGPVVQLAERAANEVFEQ